MTFHEVLASTITLLRSRGRVSYRSLKREFDIDDGFIEDLKDELTLTLRLARDEAGTMLVWNGAPAIANVFAPATGPAALTESAGEPEAKVAAERRQLTVLFCDIAGFTELANRVDPEVLHQIIRSFADACAACVVRYDGYVFQRLVDGIVAFFGYPLAHEGEAERAIHAGLEIIAALSRLAVPEVGHLAVRVGIATGLVVVSSSEKGAVGETMNLAARLQGICEPGSIVVSERVHRLAGGSFDYEDLGIHSLKGIAKSSHAYRIVGVSEATSRFEAANQGILTPLVGREHEISMLLERWQLARDGEGQVVLLSGEPGIGKSRVLSALRGRIEAQGAQALRFQCSPYNVNSAFWPSIDYFERELKFGHDESPQSKLDKLEAMLVGHYGQPLQDVRFVAAILSIPCEERYGPLLMTPQQQKNEILRTLVDITEAAARQRPTVLFYEDAHWADPTSLELLDLLVDRLRGFPLLVVLTHRPEFRVHWAGHGHVAALNLTKLTRGQSTDIVFELAGRRSLPKDLLDRILEKTDGVPLYVEELTKAILESGELIVNADRLEYAGAARSVSIPATLRDSLMARLDRFAAVKVVAQIGAVIGRSFSYELVEKLTPLSSDELNTALEQLTESGLAFRRGSIPNATYTFKHALVQDAAYESLLRSHRQELHAKTARILEKDFPRTADTEPELLAHHSTRAGRDAEAVDYWTRAGRLAIRRLALKEAVSHLRSGLDLVDAMPRSVERDGQALELRTLHGTASLALEGWQSPAVWTSLQPALALAKSLGRKDSLMAIYWGLWVYVLTQGRIEETIPWVEEMLAAADQSGDEDLLIAARRAASVTDFYRGEFTSCSSHGDRVLAIYDEVRHHHIADVVNTDPKTAVGNFVSAATWMLGYPDRAVEMSNERDAHARRRAHPFDLGYALMWGGNVFDLRREPEPLLARVAEAEQIGHDFRLPFISEVLAQLMKGLAWLRAGRLDEGLPQFRMAIGRWSAGGGLALMPYYNATLAECMALNGDPDGGLRLIQLSLEQIARPGWGERAHFAEVLRLNGWMLQLRGDVVAAEQRYLQSLEVAREQRAKSWELRTATSLARLRQTQGRRDEAVSILAPVYRWFTEGFDTPDLKDASALLDELER